MASYSSTAYAFVWLMAIINSVTDEMFPAPGGRYHFFETAFSAVSAFSTSIPHPPVHRLEPVDDGAGSLRTRLKQDLEVWKAIAELSGISRAFRDEFSISQSEDLLALAE
jgi:hypothetical protein